MGEWKLCLSITDNICVFVLDKVFFNEAHMKLPMQRCFCYSIAVIVVEGHCGQSTRALMSYVYDT